MTRSQQATHSGNETAVSPVIGVILMISITLVIAATLSAFAGGSSASLEKTPSATIAVRSAGEGEDFSLLFEHQGGDVLRTDDLEIVTWVKTGTDSTVKHTQVADADRSDRVHPSMRLPYVYESQSDSTDREFGTAVWRPGTVAGTGNLPATAEFLGMSEDDLSGLIAKDTPIEVDIVYLPTGNLLAKTEFILGA